ncbi:hypothetical protein CBR_g23889 [Chara braunii]|uniref:DUF1995 domain-containing protein n=1 Tax=Chara braunii TaxID=69332 RepID=A0A388L551_CHABU|nr:hypothetical protein CBR_g23889 [Chara braunii]|eukprot:GBG77440.1 hypothetical protein CBR_g23889 [Chara braunii]
MALSLATCPACGQGKDALNVVLRRSSRAHQRPRAELAQLWPRDSTVGYSVTTRSGDLAPFPGGSGKSAGKVGTVSRSAGNLPVTWHRLSSRMSAAADSSAGQSADRAARSSREWPLPRTSQESVDQAIGACKAAIADGLTRLQVEILLPLIGPTDLDDWPGGIQQQFRAAEPIVESLLQGLTSGSGRKEERGERGGGGGGGGGGIGYGPLMLDEGDAVGLWEREEVAAVVFPTAETLPEVQQVASRGGDHKPLVLVNAQWQGGQVVSDFGFGAKKRAAEAFVGSFTPTYFLKQLRILGEEVRILRRYPDGWQVFVVTGPEEVDCVAVLSDRPEYRKVEEILKGRKGSKAGQGWFDRLMSELKFNQDSLKK